jgi:hypothetical protein
MTDLARTPNRDAHTDAMLMWQESCEFVAAACDTPWYRTPRLHLAAHGVELALKSHLRARGYSIAQLINIGHSLVKCLAHCEQLGLSMSEDKDVLGCFQFMSEAHANHEWRYGHKDHPPHMEYEEWSVVARWALGAAIPAVAENAADDPVKIPQFKSRMAVQIDRAFQPAHADFRS